MGVIDGIVIGFIVICALIGLSRGFFDSILTILGSVLSIFVAIWASKPVSNLLNKMFKLNGILAKFVESKVGEGEGIKILFGLELSVQEAAKYLTLIISGVLIFLIIKLVIFLLSKLFDSATQNSSALSGINRLLGLLFGAAKGALYIGVAFLVTGMVGNIMFGQQIQDQLSKNTFSNTIYGYVNSQDTQEKIKDFVEDFLKKDKTEPPVEENEQENTGDETETETPADNTGGQEIGE